jgi:aldehyde:ferredoxin oxidoreductase
LVKNVADVATVVHIRATGADTDNVSGRGDVAASGKAQGGVRATGSILTERTITDCCVALAGRVGKERVKTDGRVVVTGCVVLEQERTAGRVG